MLKARISRDTHGVDHGIRLVAGIHDTDIGAGGGELVPMAGTGFFLLESKIYIAISALGNGGGLSTHTQLANANAPAPLNLLR